jgi:hypothetical protein
MLNLQCSKAYCVVTLALDSWLRSNHHKQSNPRDFRNQEHPYKCERMQESESKHS